MAKKKSVLNLSRISSALENTISTDAPNPSVENQEQNEREKIKLQSQPSVNLFRIINIQKDQIRKNEKNDFPIVEIERLEWSILHFGLLEALSVHYLPEINMYELESGERRYTAITNLINRYGNSIPDDSEEYRNYKKNVEQFDLNGIPCKIESDGDLLYSEARLIIANAERRPDDPVFLAKKTNDLAKIYAAINQSLPEKERFNINQKIASDLGMGTRQVIRNKQFGSLQPELQEVLADTTGINEGARYHTLSSDAQKKLAKDIAETGIIPDVNTAKKIYNNNDDKANTELPEADQSQADQPDVISPEKIAAIQKSANVKAALKGLNRQIKKMQSALNEYLEVEPELIQALELSDPETIKDQIWEIIHELQIKE